MVSKRRYGGNHIRYVVEPIDIDGDGIPDGDLVKEYRGDKMLKQKFVPLKKMEQIFDNAIHKSYRSPDRVGEKKEQIIYKREPQHPEDKPLIIKDETSFGQNLKQGLGLGVGVAVGETVVQGIVAGLSELFS